MGRRKRHVDDPLVSTKHRQTTLAMLVRITAELEKVYGSDWNRDDTLLLLAQRAGFAHHAPAGALTWEKLNHAR